MFNLKKSIIVGASALALFGIIGNTTHAKARINVTTIEQKLSEESKNEDKKDNQFDKEIKRTHNFYTKEKISYQKMNYDSHVLGSRPDLLQTPAFSLTKALYAPFDSAGLQQQKYRYLTKAQKRSFMRELKKKSYGFWLGFVKGHGYYITLHDSDKAIPVINKYVKISARQSKAAHKKTLRKLVRHSTNASVNSAKYYKKHATSWMKHRNKLFKAGFNDCDNDDEFKIIHKYAYNKSYKRGWALGYVAEFSDLNSDSDEPLSKKPLSQFIKGIDIYQKGINHLGHHSRVYGIYHINGKLYWGDNPD